MKAMTIGRIKNELDNLKERIDEGLSARSIAIWLFSIVSGVVDYLVEEKKKSRRSRTR